jgi:hypothetical protein
MIEVSHARYLGDYTIEISFSTGESGVVDLAQSLWGPVFEPLRSVDRFRRFTVSPTLHTITWDDEADFAPEYLRDRMLEQAAAAHSVRLGGAEP